MTVPWTCFGWLALHPFEGDVAIRVNAVDLLDPTALDAHDVALPQARQLLVHLIPYPPLSFSGQVVILPSGLPRPKADAIGVWARGGHDLAGGKGRDAERVGRVRLRQLPVLPKRRRLVAKHPRERD